MVRQPPQAAASHEDTRKMFAGGDEPTEHDDRAMAIQTPPIRQNEIRAKWKPARKAKTNLVRRIKKGRPPGNYSAGGG